MITQAFLCWVGEFSVAPDDTEVSSIKVKLFAADDTASHLSVTIIDKVAERKDRPRLSDQPTAQLLWPRELRNTIHLDDGRSVQGIVVTLGVILLTIVRIRSRQERHIPCVDRNACSEQQEKAKDARGSHKTVIEPPSPLATGNEATH
jgi:hypothetical protein